MADNSPRVVIHDPVTINDLAILRTEAIELAHAAGLDDDRADDFAVAVSEIATNSITHAGGTGRMTMFQEDALALYAEITDHGPGMPSTTPTKPPPGALSGRGLWIAQQVTDGLRIDSGRGGTTIRVRMTLGE